MTIKGHINGALIPVTMATVNNGTSVYLRNTKTPLQQFKKKRARDGGGKGGKMQSVLTSTRKRRWSLLVEPAEGKHVFGSVSVFRLPMLVRLTKRTKQKKSKLKTV